VEIEDELIPVRAEWLKLARRVGGLFGLHIYGLDVLETANGPVVVDINDFPSFGRVPGAVGRIAKYIISLAEDSHFREHSQYRGPDAFPLISGARLVLPARDLPPVSAALSLAAGTTAGANHSGRNGNGLTRNLEAGSAGPSGFWPIQAPGPEGD
jgi:hypothetical protein